MTELLDHTFKLSITQLTTICAVMNGLVFTFLLLEKGENGRANRFLSLALLSMCFTITPFMLGSAIWHTYRWLAWLPFSLSYWIGPSFYFYTRSLTDAQFRFRKTHLWHFVPIALNYFHSVYHVLADPSNPFPMLHHVTEILESAAVLSILIYMYLSHRAISTYQDAILNRVSYLDQVDLGGLKWIIWVIAASFICIILLISILGGFLIKDTMDDWEAYRNAILLFYAIVLYWLAIHGYRQAQTISIPKDVEEAHVEPISSLAKGLLQTMDKDKLYLNAQLNLADLSRATGFSERAISDVLNGELKKNFYTFVNEYRVEEVKRRLRAPDGDRYKLLAIAFESGFNSKASFNRIFKDSVGVTPNKYRTQIWSKNA